MFSEENCRKCWNCPTDRELLLRAKLNSGWSIHTANIFKATETIPVDELQRIENVIRRANELERLEVERVGKMICKLENMTRNVLGDGRKTCSMCGLAFGFFKSASILCVDCDKAVCEKCRVDTLTASLDSCVLCKICSENREVCKKSGKWFYGKFPTMIEEYNKERSTQISVSPCPKRAYDTWEHKVPDIVRLESFQPPEENHNDNSQYKDWTMNSSTPDLNALETDDDESQPIEEESFRKHFYDRNSSDTNLLTVQSAKLSVSCPALADLQETSKLTRKSSIRRKKKSAPIRKIVNKILK